MLLPKFTISRGVLSALLALGVLISPASGRNRNSHVWARTVLHADGSQSKISYDKNTKLHEEETYSVSGVLQMKRVYTMNRHGKPATGKVLDARGNLLLNLHFRFDATERPLEMLALTPDGHLARRVIYKYDPAGKELTPLVLNYKVPSSSRTRSPMMTPNTDTQALIDKAMAAPHSVNETNARPAQQPPRARPVAAKKKRKGLFSIFKKKKNR